MELNLSQGNEDADEEEEGPLGEESTLPTTPTAAAAAAACGAPLAPSAAAAASTQANDFTPAGIVLPSGATGGSSEDAVMATPPTLNKMPFEPRRDESPSQEHDKGKQARRAVVEKCNQAAQLALSLPAILLQDQVQTQG